MRAGIQEIIESVTGSTVTRAVKLGGGCVGDVARIELASGKTVVAKTGDADSGLAVEGMMLAYLRENSGLPVPDVLHASGEILLMSDLPSGGGLDRATQEHAADLVAALHNVTRDRFGFEAETVIGGLPQPNPETVSWIEFFRDARLLYMAGEAERAGRLPDRLRARLDAMAARLTDWIGEPTAASLIHGDMWTGNVLSHGGEISGFIDPAIYYADPEIELAFTTMFGTFGDAFFSRYNEHRPLAPGFFEERRDLYNLYPLLVHVRLFGGGYVSSVERTLERFGF